MWSLWSEQMPFLARKEKQRSQISQFHFFKIYDRKSANQRSGVIFIKNLTYFSLSLAIHDILWSLDKAYSFRIWYMDRVHSRLTYFLPPSASGIKSIPCELYLCNILNWCFIIYLNHSVLYRTPWLKPIELDKQTSRSGVFKLRRHHYRTR